MLNTSRRTPATAIFSPFTWILSEETREVSTLIYDTLVLWRLRTLSTETDFNIARTTVLIESKFKCIPLILSKRRCLKVPATQIGSPFVILNGSGNDILPANLKKGATGCWVGGGEYFLYVASYMITASLVILDYFHCINHVICLGRACLFSLQYLCLNNKVCIAKLHLRMLRKTGTCLRICIDGSQNNAKYH